MSLTTGKTQAHIYAHTALLSQVANLVPAIDKARLYRGKGGEVMREAVCKLVSACARVGLPLNKAQHQKVQEAVDENLRHPNGSIQKLAVTAVGDYARCVCVCVCARAHG